MSNIESMVQLNKEKNAKKVMIAKEIIIKKMNAGEPITIKNLVEETKLSRSFFHHNSEIKDLIEESKKGNLIRTQEDTVELRKNCGTNQWKNCHSKEFEKLSKSYNEKVQEIDNLKKIINEQKYQIDNLMKQVVLKKIRKK